MSDITAVDLFCGAGGFSTGLALACERLDRDVELHAINHDEIAIATHETNHPWANHYHSKVEELHPPNVVDGSVDILVAGPECTHFSNARGGKPVSEQQRASPWHVVDWLEKLDVEAFVIENVKELEQWGPVEDGQPTRDGTVFEAWINALHALGYSVDWTTLTAANYGDPTTRERLFVAGRKEHRAAFPEPTHSDDNPELPDWRTAAEIIDWSDRGGSIWTRDLEDARRTPLAANTMARIAEGLRRHGPSWIDPLADAVAGVTPDRLRELRERPVPLQYAGTAAEVLTEPFLVKYYGTSTVRPVTEPVDTVTADGGKFALCQPYLLRQQSGGSPTSVSEPLPTVATKAAIGKVESELQPLVMPKNYPKGGLHSNRLYAPQERPFHTVTGDPRAKLLTPYLCPMYNGREGQRPRTRSIDRPLSTVVASKSPAGLSQPFLVDYHGNSTTAAVDEPLGAVETKDRYALCVPDAWPWGIDVRYRMLKPSELQQAQGFPADYEIVGNKSEQRKQIGNAVPVNLATALVRKLLTGDEPSLTTYGGGVESGGVEADD